jgi:hypothetical protein
MQLVWRTFCKSIKELRPCANLPPKVVRTNVLEWRTPEDRDEKTRRSCIKTPQLGHGDNDVQSPQLRGPWSKMQKTKRDTRWVKTGPGKAQAGQPSPFWWRFGPPFLWCKVCGTLIVWASRHSSETPSSSSESPSKRGSTMRETLGGGHSRERSLPSPREVATRKEDAKSLPQRHRSWRNEDPSSSEASTISTVPCLVPDGVKSFVYPWSCNGTGSLVTYISCLMDHLSIIPFCWWCLMFKASYCSFGVAPVDRVNIPCSLGLVLITFA